MFFSKICLTGSTFALLTAAYPSLSSVAKQGMIEDEPNSGFFPNTGFNEKDQFVNVARGSGHEWMAPRPDDIRGPCPGLNAAANHGFIHRSGLLSIIDTVTGLKEAYNFGADFSEPLAVFSIVEVGDIFTQLWSIGGPPCVSKLGRLGGILGNPTGLSYSHSRYEGDASPTRGDAYLNDGDAYSLILPKFQNIYNMGQTYSLANLRKANMDNYAYSVANNPYFFSGPISGLVPPIAHHFVITLMSNHSADQIQGYLDRNTFKSFWSVGGPDTDLQWTPGHERIPDNWYKRPSNNPYGIAAAFGDLGIFATQFPSIIEIGGNLGAPNTFTGVDIGNLTGGVFNAETLLQGNNLGCFFFEAFSAGLTSQLSEELIVAQTLITKALKPIRENFGCKPLEKIDANQFSQFPGYNYRPTGKC